MMERPVVQNAANPGEVKKAQKAERHGRDQELADLRWLLSDPRGRRVLRRYIEECGVYRSVYNPSGSAMYFHEGRRSVGMAIYDDARAAAPEQVLVMDREASERERGR